MCKLIISLVLVAAFMLPGIHAQEYIAQVKYFGLEDGLSHRDVQCIHQDSQGFIWIGTNYGLNRFDGYDFKWFTKEKNGLQSNIINHILEDEDGWMWLIHAKSRAFPSPLSIDLFNPLTEEVLSLEERFGKTLPFELRDVSSFAASPDGRIAFVTTGKKLILYSRAKGFEIAGLDIYPFSLALFSERNTIWGYSSKNDPSLKDVLAEIDLNGKIRKRYEHDFPFQYNYIGGTDLNGELWYLLKHWGSRWETDQKGKIFKIDSLGFEREFPLAQTQLPPGSVNLDIPAYANEYRFWISPNNGFYWLFARNSFQVFHPASGWHSELSSSYPGLAHPNVAFFDNIGNAWVGTEFGLYVIELNKNPFLKIAHQSAGEKQSAFRGITEDPGHTLWACIDRGPGWIGRFRPKGHHFEQKITEWENSQWGRGYKYGIFTDSRGFVWFGSGEDEIIIRYNPAVDTYRVIPDALARKTGENRVNIWSFFEDRQGRTWFGTDAGVIGYVAENLIVSTLDELEGLKPKGGCIYQFLEDKNGRVWVATDNGLFTLDPKQNKVSAYKRDGLFFLREGIFHIHEDDDGSLWIGTNGVGLIHWYPDTGKYQQFTKADGLSNNTIYAVYEDEHDNLWMSSDYGIIRFGKSTHRVTAYLEKDGIAHREFNRISHFRGEDGMIYFGGLNGITAFHPKDLEGETRALDIPLVLTGFQQFDDHQNQLIDKTIALRASNTITLTPNDHFFRVEFALLNFIETENIQYAYKIEGVDAGCLSNACKFTPGKGAIHVQADDLGHSIRISVRDTGRGIHPDDLPYVFDRFFQSRATDIHTEGGAGIGLALSQELARLMGGSIQVESELGKGSTFWFELPRKEVMGSVIVPETEISQPRPSEMLTGSSGQPSLEKGCILIVEDNKTLGAYLQNILSAGYNVTLTQNGAEALEVLPELSECEMWKKNGGVILSDIMMPVMDGFQLLERLKSDPCFAHIPVIMLTARADMQDKLHALRAGVDDYLLKPFAEDELKARISNLLDHYRQRRAFSGELEGAGPVGDEPGSPSMAPNDLLWLENLESKVRESVQDDTLTVQLMAAKVFLSERQLHRRLKALTGLSPNEYLREIRLQEARRLLESRLARSVKEAAFSVCFRDEKYFAQIFKARFGKNPSEI